MSQATSRLSVNLGVGSASSSNLAGSFDKIVNKSEKDAQILRWISPLKPDNRHQGVRNDRFDGVGNWLLETREFREWREFEGGPGEAVLFCSGNPGVGKTYLSSLVIDSLCEQAKKEDIAVAYLYCDFFSQREQTCVNMLGAILKQLVGRGEIPEHLRGAFEQALDNDARGLLLLDLTRTLRIVVASLPQVFVCIDALDECLPKHLPDLLKSLRDISRQCPRMRIFLTGRPHIREDVRGCFKAVVISIIPNMDDIKNFIERRLDIDREPDAMNDYLRRDIIKIIVEKISHIFLLVSLSLDTVLEEVTIRQRRKKLEEMTRGNGLDDAYTATLNRVRAQRGDKSILGLKVLMWVLYSERPLRTVELCHALAVEVGSAELDLENLPTLRTLLSSCQGLVIVEASSSTVRLVHHTLQEYLSSDPTVFLGTHSTIAEVCLTYLNFGSVRDLSPTLCSTPSTVPFLEYASCYWGDHARRGMTKNVKKLALRLLDRLDEHISAKLMLLHYNKHTDWGNYFHAPEGPTGFTALHGVAFLGIVRIVDSVLEMEQCDVNATDGMGRTALTWAAVRGQEEVVKMLLENEGINPDQADAQDGQTPLLLAAREGHAGIVKMLLEQAQVNPDKADTGFDFTPLSWAAVIGNEGVVKVLLERADVNPDNVGPQYGRTPISWAAGCGHEGVLKILLERADVCTNRADTQYGRTPLLWAAEHWNEAIVQMLLDRADVNPNHTDIISGKTLLLQAAELGHEGVVKMLLERSDVNPDQVDTKYGRTPISLAADRGHEGVVKMLLERADVNPDKADTQYGRTPLSWAARSGYEEITEMLLEREDVDPDHADTEYGRTPLLWAAQRWNEGVVKMLLQRADVNPNQADTISGKTLLLQAAEFGQEQVVKMLLERTDVNPDQPDTQYGRTPLSWAAQYGRGGVVKMLLERADVNPGRADTEYGRTPLSWAAGAGHEGVVEMLLERAGVNPNRADIKYGRAPISWAAECGREGVVRVLLDRAGVNPNRADTEYGRTPLCWASRRGHVGVVKMLLERADINPNHEDSKYGRTPISWAAEYGHEGAVLVLLEREDVDPDRADSKYGRTPLSWAAGRGHFGIVKLLLERKDVYNATLDSKSQTPLWWALSKGYDEIVRILQEPDIFSSSTADPHGQASLPPSARHGH